MAWVDLARPLSRGREACSCARSRAARCAPEFSVTALQGGQIRLDVAALGVASRPRGDFVACRAGRPGFVDCRSPLGGDARRGAFVRPSCRASAPAPPPASRARRSTHGPSAHARTRTVLVLAVAHRRASSQASAKRSNSADDRELLRIELQRANLCCRSDAGTSARDCRSQRSTARCRLQSSTVACTCASASASTGSRLLFICRPRPVRSATLATARARILVRRGDLLLDQAAEHARLERRNAGGSCRDSVDAGNANRRRELAAGQWRCRSAHRNWSGRASRDTPGSARPNAVGHAEPGRIVLRP